MKIKTIIIVLGMLLPILSIRAQDIKLLSVGDTVPDLILHNVINYKDSVIRLSDFKDKLVILDFWATWCTSCIESFPKFIEFQKKYASDIFPILVSTIGHLPGSDTPEKVNHFFANRFRFKELACVLETRILNTYFPHQSLPHTIWLKGNKILAITDGREITESNILAVIQKNNPTLSEKKEQRRAPTDSSLFSNLQFQYITDYKVFSKEIPGIRNTFGVDRNISGHVRYYIYNESAEVIYRWAYPELHSLPYRSNRIVFQNTTSGVSGAIKNKDDFQDNSKWFCYEHFFTNLADSESLKIIQNDISEYFGWKPINKKIDTTCYVVSVGNSQLLRPSQRQKSDENIYDLNVDHRFGMGIELSYLFNRLNMLSTVPIVDETGYKARIDIVDLPLDLINIDDLTVSLSKIGLKVKKTNRILDYYLFTNEKKTYK